MKISLLRVLLSLVFPTTFAELVRITGGAAVDVA